MTQVPNQSAIWVNTTSIVSKSAIAGKKMLPISIDPAHLLTILSSRTSKISFGLSGLKNKITNFWLDFRPNFFKNLKNKVIILTWTKSRQNNKKWCTVGSIVLLLALMEHACYLLSAHIHSSPQSQMHNFNPSCTSAKKTPY